MLTRIENVCAFRFNRSGGFFDYDNVYYVLRIIFTQSLEDISLGVMFEKFTSSSLLLLKSFGHDLLCH